MALTKQYTDVNKEHSFRYLLQKNTNKTSQSQLQLESFLFHLSAHFFEKNNLQLEETLQFNIINIESPSPNNDSR